MGPSVPSLHRGRGKSRMGGPVTIYYTKCGAGLISVEIRTIRIVLDLILISGLTQRSGSVPSNGHLEGTYPY